MIEFIPLDDSHIPLMRQWLSDGEALRWHARDEPRSLADLRRKYLVDKPSGGTHCFIIHYDQHPIGHIQYYRVADGRWGRVLHLGTWNSQMPLAAVLWNDNSTTFANLNRLAP